MNGSIAVTGAAGFIGSAVTRLLVQKTERDTGPHVLALVRPGGNVERLEELKPGPNWSLVFVDLAERESLLAVLRRHSVRAVVHVASDRRIYHEFQPDEYSPWHVGPIETLFEALSGAEGARFIHTGSAWVLRGGSRLTEFADLAPASTYALNKSREDALLPVLGAKFEVPWINLRLFNVFGKYEAPTRLLPYLVQRLSQGLPADLSHGFQLRDFNDVEAIAEAYLRALEAPDEACGLIYHIGSGQALTARDFALAAAEVAGNPELIRFGAGSTADENLPSLVADAARARRVLNWRPAADVRAGIRRAAQWWLDRAAFIHSKGAIA